MRVDAQALLAIAGMALVTYTTRAGGFWLLGRFTPSPRLEAWLGYLPGAVLVSVAAPVRDEKETVVATVSVVIPIGSLDARRVGPAVRAGARAISRALGSPTALAPPTLPDAHPY